tara:strand:+ start:238 stop:1071 length:834 start_codon:yes stop_codon:yes gene_type:complete
LPSALNNSVATAMLTDVGRVRNNNEDAITIDPELGLLLLSDGMGGYQAGEVASAIANETVLNVVRGESRGIRTAEEDRNQANWPQTVLLEKAVTQAHKAIHEAAASRPECAGMGTTIVAVWLHQNRMSIAHVGDSRLYRFRIGELTQITRDHSLVEEMIARGEYSRQDAQHMVRKNIVTRALGAEGEVRVELNDRSLEIGDLLLMCSDGLSDLVTDENIRVTLRQYHDDLEAGAQQLIQQALRAGGKDNVSVILARIDQSFSAPKSLPARLLSWLKG